MELKRSKRPNLQARIAKRLDEAQLDHVAKTEFGRAGVVRVVGPPERIGMARLAPDPVIIAAQRPRQRPPRDGGA